jgi:hypothetical protein
MFADYCRADLWHVVGQQPCDHRRVCVAHVFVLPSESPPARSSVAFVRAENGGLPLQGSLQRLEKALGNK